MGCPGAQFQTYQTNGINTKNRDFIQYTSNPSLNWRAEEFKMISTSGNLCFGLITDYFIKHSHIKRTNKYKEIFQIFLIPNIQCSKNIYADVEQLNII